MSKDRLNAQVVEIKNSSQDNFNAQLKAGLTHLEESIKSHIALDFKTHPFFEAKKIIDEKKDEIKRNAGDELCLEALHQWKEAQEWSLEENFTREKYSTTRFLFEFGKGAFLGSSIAFNLVHYFFECGSLEEKIVASFILTNASFVATIPKLTERTNAVFSEHQEFIQGLNELDGLDCLVNEKKAIVNFKNAWKKAVEAKTIEHAVHAAIYIAESQYRLIVKAKAKSNEKGIDERIERAIQMHQNVVKDYKHVTYPTRLRIIVSQFKLLNVIQNKHLIISVLLDTLNEEIKLDLPYEKLIQDILKKLISSNYLTEMPVWKLVVDRMMSWQRENKKENINGLLIEQLQRLKSLVPKETNYEYFNTLGNLISLLRNTAKEFRHAEEFRKEAIIAYAEASKFGFIPASLSAAKLIELDGETTDDAIEKYQIVMQAALTQDDAEQIIKILTAVFDLKNTHDLELHELRVIEEISLSAFAKLNDTLFIRKYPLIAANLWQKICEWEPLGKEVKKNLENYKVYHHYLNAEHKFEEHVKSKSKESPQLLQAAEEHFLPAILALLAIHLQLKKRFDRPLYLKAKALLLGGESAAIPELKSIFETIEDLASQSLKNKSPREQQSIRMAQFYRDTINECKSTVYPVDPDTFILQRTETYFKEEEKEVVTRIFDAIRKTYGKSKEWLDNKKKEKDKPALLYSHGKVQPNIAIIIPPTMAPLPTAPSPVSTHSPTVAVTSSVDSETVTHSPKASVSPKMFKPPSPVTINAKKVSTPIVQSNSSTSSTSKKVMILT